MLDADNRLAEATGEASLRLDNVHDPEESEREEMPEVLKTLAIWASAQSPAESAPASCVRLLGRDGAWLSLHASGMNGADSGAQRVAVVISPAAAPDLRPLLFSSHRLTAGERQDSELVLQGRSTQEIASALYISPYTVQDRFKSIFEKFGVRSRRELVARMHAVQPR